MKTCGEPVESIGVLGGGQLGRMLALAGYPLGFSFRFYDPAPGVCAGQVGELVTGGYDDEAALAGFGDGLDLITYEFENVPVAAARALAAHVPVYPPPEALEVAQDRLVEKRFFRELDVPTAEFRDVESAHALAKALGQTGLPAVLKTRREGYDGKGQLVIRAESEVDDAWSAFGGRPLILEAFVPFDREVSILAARGRDGSMRFYPLVENTHVGGILRRSVAPAPGIAGGLQRTADECARRVLDELDYVGVLAIEFFVVGDRLLASELAPRIHNSGHWTIEGAETSQFENHLRAVAGLPLGSTAARGHAAMLNLIGSTPALEDVLAVPNAHLHLYGKAPRPGRKVGHVTVRSDDLHALWEQVDNVAALIERAGRE